MTSSSTSDSWTSAIYSATSCLRTRNTHDVDHCIDFLTQLENQLRFQHQNPQGDSWSQPPTHPAPDWIEYLNRVHNMNASHTFSQTRQSTDFIIRAPNTGFHWCLDIRQWEYVEIAAARGCVLPHYLEAAAQAMQLNHQSILINGVLSIIPWKRVSVIVRHTIWIEIIVIAHLIIKIT